MSAGSVPWRARLALSAAFVATSCILNLDAGTSGGRDPSLSDAGADVNGKDVSVEGSAGWGATAGGGAAGGGDGASAGSGGSGGTSSGATGGSGGCSPHAEICDNGSDDDCDQKADCADEDCAFQACGPESECKSGSCTSVYATATVACGNSGQTGTQLCQAAGWQGCTDSVGYWWWQCAGPGDCPTAWSALSCDSYASAQDCVGYSLSTGDFHTAMNGCDGIYGAVDFGYNCTSFNPGYTVRLQCF